MEQSDPTDIQVLTIRGRRHQSPGGTETKPGRRVCAEQPDMLTFCFQPQNYSTVRGSTGLISIHCSLLPYLPPVHCFAPALKFAGRKPSSGVSGLGPDVDGQTDCSDSS